MRKLSKYTNNDKRRVRSRIMESRMKADKSMRNLDIQTYRRIQAEKGNILRALFGRPKRRKI